MKFICGNLFSNMDILLGIIKIFVKSLWFTLSHIEKRQGHLRNTEEFNAQ